METSLKSFLNRYKKRGETVADEARKVLIQFMELGIIDRTGCSNGCGFPGKQHYYKVRQYSVSYML